MQQMPQEGTQQEVVRVVRWFERNTEDVVGELKIPSVELQQLQKVFNLSDSNPLFDSYPIETAEQIDYIQKVSSCKINLERYDYFLECDAVQQMPEELNERHWIEALERASLMSDIFETMRSHPVFIQTPALQERLREIDNKLGEFYQAVGVESEKSRTKEIDKDNDYWEGYMDGN